MPLRRSSCGSHTIIQSSYRFHSWLQSGTPMQKTLLPNVTSQTSAKTKKQSNICKCHDSAAGDRPRTHFMLGPEMLSNRCRNDCGIVQSYRYRLWEDVFESGLPAPHLCNLGRHS